MEASGIATVDLKNKATLYLDMVQTVGRHEGETLLDYYASTIITRKEKRQVMSKYLVADAYFSKQPFADEFVNHRFHVVSRFRKNSNLRYLYHGMHPTGPGRAKKYDGKVNFQNLRDEDFTACAIDEAGKWIAYYGRVNSPALNRDIGLVVIHDLKRTDQSKSIPSIYQRT